MNNIKFFKDFSYGLKIGSAVVTSCVITRPLMLSRYPFLNRMLEVGIYNYLQDAYFSPIIPSKFTSLTENFLYKGVFQAVKWFPNRWVQNWATEFYPTFLLKNAFVVLSGMIPFNVISNIEAKIDNVFVKSLFAFTSASIIYFAPYKICISKTYVSKKKGIYFSPYDHHKAQAGLIGAYIFVQLTNKYLPKNILSSHVDLATLTILTLTTEQTYKISCGESFYSSLSFIANEMGRICAYGLAKAIGGVIVDNIQIPSFNNSSIKFEGLISKTEEIITYTENQFNSFVKEVLFAGELPDI